MTQATPLRGAVALVTGASRGIGKGVALELGSLGATVYFTARTLAPGANPLGGTLDQTAAEIEAQGGEAVALRCDHADDAQVRAVFDRIRRERGRLDILVNNACSAQDMGRHIGLLAWEQPLEAWDEVHRVGLRSAYVASVLAAPLMVAQRSGLIANVSSMGAVSYLHSVAYGTAKAGLDKLAADLAWELAPHGVTAVSLWPGLVRTELVLSQCRDDGRCGLEMVLPAHAGDAGPEQVIDLAISESPRFTGRAVAALHLDERRHAKSGRAFACAELALEYGFTVNIEIKIEKMPFKGKIRYSQYLIDNKHSNSYSLKEKIDRTIETAKNEAKQKAKEYLSKKWEKQEIEKLENLINLKVPESELLKKLPKDKRTELSEAKKINREYLFGKIEEINKWPNVKLQKVEEDTSEALNSFRKTINLKPYAVTLIVLQKLDK